MISTTQSGVGRKKINYEQTPARLREGTLAAIATVLREKESLADFIRDSVEKELNHRGAKRKPPEGGAE
ncbi:MAG: hypothetical protein JWO51_114 [Rhodospirillales bacterium]|nr:hypothetical protein [Rhodospirillales bacterium]